MRSWQPGSCVLSPPVLGVSLLTRISHTCFSRFDFTEIRTILGSLWVMRLPIAAVRATMAVLTGLHTARGVFEAHLDLPRPVKIFLFAPARLVS